MNTTLCSLSGIFRQGDIKKIIIPKLQRDYAQGRQGTVVKRVRDKFLEALYDAVMGNPIKLDFVYGSLDEDGTFTPLDGQQRLTTLFLLYWYAAKKENVVPHRYEFLKFFGYETRYSARDFCTTLIDFNPGFTNKLSEEIKDATWFPLDWLNDPTIRSMLIMLDDIDNKFKNVEGLFDKLDGDAVTFYFRAIEDLGLTDELYIKMNSRGKPLTLFEHFKAELLRELKAVDKDLANNIAHKIDREWTDLLWAHRNIHDDRIDNDSIDDAFLRYFRFICDMICYGNGYVYYEGHGKEYSAVGRNNDEFALIEKYFSHTLSEAKKNFETLESYFDVWFKLGEESTGEFFSRFISLTHEPGKIICNDIDLFEKCIFGYAEVTLSDKKHFTPGEMVRLFAFTTYLAERDVLNITEMQFARRLRIINNLILNSVNEVRDTPDSDSGNRIPRILKLVREILKGEELGNLVGKGNKESKYGFNPTQFEEEIEKEDWVRKNPARAEELYALEDHKLLNGQIGVVGLSNADRFARFASLFSCNYDAVSCAMLAKGDYSQTYRNKVQLGERKRDLPWQELFHSSKYDGFDNTSKILRALLDEREIFDDVYLRNVAESYIKKCGEDGLYDWRYYFIKYNCFRPDENDGNFNQNGYGKYVRFDLSKQYEMIAMLSRLKLTNISYKPFLAAIGTGDMVTDDPYNIVLRIKNYIVKTDNEGYLLCDASGKAIEDIRIPQQNSVDTVDRIGCVKTILKKYL